MLSPKRAIFREAALQSYRQQRSRDVLPRYVSPPVIVVFWCFFLLCLGILLAAWNVRLPLYQGGVAVILDAHQVPSQSFQHADLLALVLFSPQQKKDLHAGMQVQFLGTATQQWQEKLTDITPMPLSPQVIRDTYHLDSHLSLLVAQPALVAVIPLQQHHLSFVYTGALFQAQVQTGTQSLLSVMPFVGKLLGA